jgi:hypothetical protein
MDQAPYLLDARRRADVLESIREACEYRHWALLATHVRSTHVHVIVEGEDLPENNDERLQVICQPEAK